MKIEKLEIRGFGRFQQLTVSFSRGFNLIYGGNESGKSTLEWYIRGMLYGLKGGRSAKDGELPPLKKYKPWQTGEFGGSLDYRLDNGRGYRAVRSFSNGTVKVYDEAFHDITHSFDCGRDKTARFAERHLGVNEGCFERTALIHQMGSRVYDDASGELTNRLVNAVHTGLEDVSLKNAEKALREALHQHVGTDRSTRRPLDRVNARLQELQELVDGTREEGKQRLELEVFLQEAQEGRQERLAERALLEAALQVCLLEMEMQDSMSRGAHQAKQQEDLEQAGKEMEKVLANLEELEARQRLYACFEGLSLGDAEEMAVGHALFAASEESRASREKRLREMKRDVEEQEKRLPGKRGGSFPDEAGIARLIKADRELVRLMARQSELNPGGVAQKLGKVESRSRRAITVLAAGGGMALLTVLLQQLSLLPFPAAAAGFLAALSVSAGAWLSYRNQTREKERLLRQKKQVSIEADTLRQQMENCQKILKDAFEPAGTDNLEDFLRRKAEDDSSKRGYQALSHEIRSLEQQGKEASERSAGIRKDLLEKLGAAGITPQPGEDLQEAVLAYRQGIQGSLQLQQERMQWRSRADACRDRLEELKGRQKGESGIPEVTRPHSPEELQERLNVAKEQLHRKLDARGCGQERFAQLLSVPSFLWLRELQLQLNGSLQKLAADMEEEALHIRELETRLKGGQEAGERLAAAEGEQQELQRRKEELEDLGTALNTALEVLSGAASDIQRDFSPALNHKMGEAIRRISGGRYTDLRMDEEIMLKTTAPESGDVVQALQLSAGTIDQMYLALRLAMASLLSINGETLPILLDEAFSQYDESRMLQAFQYLLEISRDRQILFLTCRSREAELARKVFGGELNQLELNCCGRSDG